MHPDLELLSAEFDAAEAEVHSLAESADDEEWSAPARNGGWSMDQCIAHLTLTNNRYVPILAEAADAAPLMDDARYRQRMRRDLVGWLTSGMMEPPVRLRIPTRASFNPSTPASKAVTVAGFDASQAAIRQLLRTVSGHDITRVRIASPFNSKVRYSVFSALHILVAHERRHIWQATTGRREK
ncbi:MAG TPA: DinB family protein [Gemmatimonadales bacterium]|nr:DinB family protein [Gemmatimonadales bacterium]